ncbi:MAG: FIST signal transduction protein [Sphingobacteriaceae bacterium]
MKAFSYKLNNGVKEMEVNPEGLQLQDSELVICFGNKEQFIKHDVYELLRKTHINSNIVLCSTAGEIYNDEVCDNTIIVNGLHFERTSIKFSSLNIAEAQNSFEAGLMLIKKFDCENLKYVFVLSDGNLVNGSELVNGMQSCCDGKILITGGLAGDGANFVSTLVGLNQKPKEGMLVAIGFYGDSLEIGHGSNGGWESFGIERNVTKSLDNVLYEIDGKNALELYKNYLGKYADELPGSALLFPLSVKLLGTNEEMVRTILSVDEKSSSMTFAGDIPQGSSVRFMKANLDRLVDASCQAAENSKISLSSHEPTFAVLISCVGRKLIFGNRIDEEVEAVKNVFGKNTVISGFYSYGEVCPNNGFHHCQLHNQTMTITTFFEK